MNALVVIDWPIRGSSKAEVIPAWQQRSVRLGARGERGVRERRATFDPRSGWELIQLAIDPCMSLITAPVFDSTLPGVWFAPTHRWFTNPKVGG